MALTDFKSAKSAHQKLCRTLNVGKERERDSKLNELLSKKPNEVFKHVKSEKCKQSTKLKNLKVDDKLYTEENIADGFFDSISQLKTAKSKPTYYFKSFLEYHRLILEMSRSGNKIPQITTSQAEELLRKIRASVFDFYSITAAHYVNGGHAAIQHFKFLVNTVLNNIELASIEEMNTSHAVVLHKGHGKDKNLASSYRTIGSCPFIAKSVDIYLGQLSKDDWKSVQAET